MPCFIINLQSFLQTSQHAEIQSLQSSTIENQSLPSFQSISPEDQSAPKSSKSPTKVQLVFAGNSAVGKTSITRRFVEEAFEEKKVPTTIGLGLYTTTRVIDERIVTVTITDTAGSERFCSVFSSSYKRASGAFLVFDVTNGESFINLPQWFTELKQEMPEKSTIVLLANKCDLKTSQVTESEIERFAEQNGLKYFKTSAKTGEGIHDALDYCVKECLTAIDQGLLTVRSPTNVLRPTRPTKRRTGCRKC